MEKFESRGDALWKKWADTIREYSEICESFQVFGTWNTTKTNTYAFYITAL